jgi:hypothetical protein
MTQAISGQTMAVCRHFHDDGGHPQDCPYMAKAIEAAIATGLV